MSYVLNQVIIGGSINEQLTKEKKKTSHNLNMPSALSGTHLYLVKEGYERPTTYEMKWGKKKFA